MREFFRGWRRKVGVMTLLMACVFMGGWLRSLITTDSVDLPINGKLGTDTISAIVTHTGMVDLFSDEKWGTLTGQVLFEGKLPIADLDNESLVIDPISKGIANVIIYLPHRPASVHPDLIRPQKPNENDSKTGDEADDSNEIRFEIKNNRFVPHICLVQTGVNIRLVSHDQVTHAVQTYPTHNSNLMQMIPAGKTDGFQLPLQLKPEKVPFKVIDPTDASMSAYWVVLDHPYAAVTDKDGKFQIPQLPVGDHRFMIWHERCGYLKKNYQIEVEKGLNEVAPIAIEPSSFR